MKQSEYILEIYEPGSMRDVWKTFSSPTPFMSISVDDIINPGVWENLQTPMNVLQVVLVEHILWETDTHIKQKVCVYSKTVNYNESVYPKLLAQ